ncbi:MAG: hypothetical protein V1862_11165 [Methanobacteriota archaeon]
MLQGSRIEHLLNKVSCVFRRRGLKDEGKLLDRCHIIHCKANVLQALPDSFRIRFWYSTLQRYSIISTIYCIIL